jgi:microcystin-dependent protein
MSYIRAKNRQNNANVFLQNRLTTFTRPPMYTGDLYVEKNETIGGNLDVSGNLTVHGDLKAKNFYATGNYYLDDYILIPPGTVMQSAAITRPGGWLLCDGSRLNTNDYPDLFNAIGHTYGGSDTSFNLPDIRGRVPIGSGSGAGLTSHSLGSTGGEESHTLTTSEIPSHSHGSNAPGGTRGLATSDGNNTAGGGLDYTPGEINLWATPTALTINNTGGGNAHNIMQPFITLNYIIKY